MITTLMEFKKASYHVVNPYAIDVLRTKKKDLVYGISHTEDLLDLLVTEGIITTMKKSIFLTMRTQQEQNSRVLDLLEANGERACRKFIYPCLMLAEPELYRQISAYVLSVNAHIRDTRRQLIGYLLERDQDISREVTKRGITQRNSVLFVLKEDGFMKDIHMKPQLESAAHTKPETLDKTDANGKMAELTDNTDVNTNIQSHQSTVEILIKQETRVNLEDTRGSTEAVDKQTPIQGTSDKHSIVEDEMFLHSAAQEDDWQQVECLLQNGAAIDARNDENKTALFYAVAKGHEKTIAALLNAGAKVDSDVIHEAIKLNKKSVLEILFDKTRGAVSEEDLKSAVFSAVRQNKEAALLALTDTGLTVNICDKQGYTPLLLSAELGHTEVFRVLIEKQANLDATLPDRSSALHLAAQGGSVPIMETLLEKGLNPNTTGPKAQMPLHVAAALNKPDIVGLLLKAGAQVNATAQDGATPLHLASQCGSEEIVARLIKEKTKLEAVDKLGRTALHWAAGAPSGSSIVDVLLSAKINVNALDYEKRSALHLAAKEGNLNTVTSLLSYKAKTGAKDKNGSTPLHYAAAGGHGSVVSALLQSAKKKGLEERNTWKKTPLHVAAEKGHDNVVVLLLEAGAKINATDQNKDTPLHCAVRGGHQGVVKRLVDWGQGSNHKMYVKKANLQATNSVGKTALQVAENEDTPEHENIATLLKRKMLLVK